MIFNKNRQGNISNRQEEDEIAKYNPKFLSWCKSYEEEKQEMHGLICGNPSDVRMLKDEYEILTGKRFRRRSK